MASSNVERVRRRMWLNLSEPRFRPVICDRSVSPSDLRERESSTSPIYIGKYVLLSDYKRHWLSISLYGS